MSYPGRIELSLNSNQISSKLTQLATRPLVETWKIGSRSDHLVHDKDIREYVCTETPGFVITDFRIPVLFVSVTK
uniref:Tubulin_C domain-containing protein n=1 Tax=Steinernema glaseri TaxID=37863 RepID=A0A1I8AR38_9BILA